MNKRQNGFTVVELLLIVVVAGLISMIAWFVVHAKNSFMQNSTKTADISTIKPVKANNSPAINNTIPKGYDFSINALTGWTTKKSDFSVVVTDGVGTVTLNATGNGRGCEQVCKQETYDYTYNNQEFRESIVTGSPGNYLYWDNLGFKDPAKMEEWLSDKAHTSVINIKYPSEKRDYYLPIFTKIWLESTAKPIY